MSHAIYHVDAFTDSPFAGNPAAVCLITGELDDDWLQAVATEMNLSETAFVRPIPGGFELRWFTPAAEVELCGHATLAAAHVLWEQQLMGAEKPIAFKTRHRGVLHCELDAESGLIAMDFPADPPAVAEPVAGLIEALGVEPVTVLRSRYDWVVEVEDSAAVREARPNMLALMDIDARGVGLTARGGEADEADFVSRFFAPRLRIDEDAVTGSLHCVLGPYWRRMLGKDVMDAAQLSQRGGRLRVAMREGDERVALAGRAVTVTVGQLLV
ncbi:PhzF family phenazine biosynthesis protein [Phycisphaerales bacterium AB-hyl4]|uniref:PhzF family phenazine biosynthesis protein n=1 Tax=Natronomicrosphaera hydrolytica TaxID=3242702 RepID=A0ABV4U836_9BACT